MTTTMQSTGNGTNGNDLIPGTGWTWSDAASMAKECAREHRLHSHRPRRTRRNTTKNVGLNDPRFEAVTGWTPEAAMAMAFEVQRENRIFGRGRRNRRYSR